MNMTLMREYNVVGFIYHLHEDRTLYLRISAAVYNTIADYDRLADALEQLEASVAAAKRLAAVSKNVDQYKKILRLLPPENGNIN